MKWVPKPIVRYIEDYSIKKKFYILYIVCVLFPLILTDTVIINSVVQGERNTQKHSMENIANAVRYSFFTTINRGSEIAKIIYMNKYIDQFLNTQYTNPLEYYNEYQGFFKNTLLGNIVGIDNTEITIYSANDTIVNGSEFQRLERAFDKEWYIYFNNSGLNQSIYFDYDKTTEPAFSARRKILFLQRLNFFKFQDREKILKIELECSNITQNITKMNFPNTVYICSNDLILVSNGKNGNNGGDFVEFTEHNNVGYSQVMSQYGTDFNIYVMKPKFQISQELVNNIPIIILLIFINTILPLTLVRLFNRSFNNRIATLSRAFNKVRSDTIVKIPHVTGKDEIGSLMRNYNLMADRINSLIQIVYKNKIKEHEITVAQKNAELLALHSQINPHFLFNALESIRMHSIIKNEEETADMVERLSIMQRQYVEWGDDQISVLKEMDFVDAYLGLQKYRFGDRLNFKLLVNDDCKNFRIPKLSIVTFVENACVHGIESKMSPGYIFVRVFTKENMLCIEVEDTGVGMSDKGIEELRHKMQVANINMLKSNSRVGVVNACLRLNIISDNNAEYELDGEEGSGLIVQIRVPIIYAI